MRNYDGNSKKKRFFATCPAFTRTYVNTHNFPVECRYGTTNGEEERTINK
jgi:hypothetical protein